MSRYDHEWLADIIGAVEAIRSYQQRGDLSDGLVFDAVRVSPGWLAPRWCT